MILRLFTALLKRSGRFLLLLTSLIIIACSYHEYDPENPDLYFEYWCDPSNMEDSLVNIVTDKYTEEDFPNEQECNEKYNEIKSYDSD